MAGDGRLPFDVLGQVFTYYLEKETPLRPFETLLLVCKAWRVAALGHPSLWGRYKIILGNDTLTKLQIRYLRARLTRIGPKTPLHIDVRYTQKSRNELTCLSMKSHILPLLKILAGSDGVLCLRWKSLRLTVELHQSTLPGSHLSAHLFAPLTYPMPSLTWLHLSLRILGEMPLFPHLPSMRSMILRRCRLQKLPDMRYATDIALDNVECLSNNTLDGVIDAPNAQYLCMTANNHTLHPSREYPALQTLYICGIRRVFSWDDLHVPRLENLILHSETIDLVQSLSYAPFLKRIRTLQLLRDGQVFSFETPHYIGPTLDLLRACTGLRMFIVDIFGLLFLLEIWSVWGPFLEKECIFQVFFKRRRTAEMEFVPATKDVYLALARTY
ncbi:hypothetical protein FRC17_000387 [Serendipita sp. 399]|nr:hypothetical protein FRC17_000387 [Serendipita sp. 399]